MITSFESTLEAPQPTSSWQEQPFQSRNRIQSRSDELENSVRKHEDISPFPKIGSDIVGNSQALKEVLRLAAVVAPTDSTVRVPPQALEQIPKRARTLMEAEREHILLALRRSLPAWAEADNPGGKNAKARYFSTNTTV